MARFTAGVRTSAGSTTLPIASLYAASSVGGILREIGIFNTTATEVALAIRRLTSVGTKPAAETDVEYNADAPAANCSVHGTHTVAPTLAAGLAKPVMLGAAIGSGVILTFGAEGLIIAPSTANGIGILIATGTGQVCDVYFVWDE